jgi:CheY-like chemotaxis protein
MNNASDHLFFGIVKTNANTKIMSTDFSGHKLLIVEDNLQNFQFLNFSANKNNIEVVHAINGLEAVKACREHPDFSLILMDAMMPELDGFDATREIKSFRPDLPIVMLTAFISQESIRKAVAAGCNDYLSKPIGLNELTATFKKWLIK